jgi:predicted solute-binding protein
VRLGISYYANAAPLTRGLDCCPEVEIVRASPAKLSDMLRRGQIDAALIGSSEYFAGDYLIIAGGAISAKGEGADAVLVSSVPLYRVRSVALSAASRTTNLMLMALMQKLRPGAPVRYEIRPEDTCRSLVDCDACLLIGDEAVECAGEGRFNYDLATLWESTFAVPMVFSLWLIRRDAPAGASDLVGQAIERGRRELELIITEEASVRRWEAGVLRRYLLESLDFGWSNLHERALLTLGQALLEAGLIEQMIELHYAGHQRAIAQEEPSQPT